MLVSAFKETSEQQQRESEKILKLVIQRRKDLEKRATFNEVVQEKTAAAKQDTEAMQEHLVKTKQEHDLLSGCVRTLCNATNTFVSTKELPARIKGVSVSQSGTRWMPFDVAASDLEGLSTMWDRLQIPSANADKWRQLMSVDNPQNDKENNYTTAATSIIEIDLTSPVSQK
ncbi:kinetochore protein Spc25 isoform X2 [Drosophila innubila]|uniref:kinetochore protein Spc25 isoform X2 n=1 Tax=Drosophila innubila TaxID=198719 RepID=UPI00148BBBBB|nr:kinetochore protein Spc25 isoform X2 [Drosophila innubila]